MIRALMVSTVFWFGWFAPRFMAPTIMPEQPVFQRPFEETGNRHARRRAAKKGQP